MFCNDLAEENISCIFLEINFCSESQDYVWIKAIFILLEKKHNLTLPGGDLAL